MAKISYIDTVDILMLSKEKKVKVSIDVGDFIIDIDHEGFVTGIEILNASESLGLTIEQLKSIEEGSMSVTYKPNYVNISIIIKFNQKEKDISIPLTLDLGHNAVTTERTHFPLA